MTRHTIVVGVDGAWHRTGAVDWAVDQARRSGASLHLVHVVDDRYAQLAALTTETASTRARELIDAISNHLRQGDTSTAITADALAGTPGAVLAEVARTAPLLVVGRRGAGTFKRLLIGSTSESVVNHADVPAVVVPDGWKPTAHLGAPIVAGVDPGAPSDAALEFAFAQAAERSVPLHLIHVWEMPAGYVWDASYASDELRSWQERSQTSFDDLVAAWRDKHPGVDLETVFGHGHPVEGLIDEADRSEAQLIVVGGRRHNRLTGLVLGSVARGVLHHAARPLAVVHDTKRASG